MTDDSPPRPEPTEEPSTEPTDEEPTAASADAPPRTEATPDADSGASTTEDESDDGDGLRRYVERAVLAVLFLFAVVVAFRFYFAASNAVSQWVADPYQSLFQAAFNLVALLVIGAGIAWQVRRMR